jgi:hypothetical protein
VQGEKTMQFKVVTGGAEIIPFRKPAGGARLSMRDRMDVTYWQESARQFGYDRLVIHERAPCDPPDVDSFLSIYRRGEAWSRWGVARCGSTVLAWCSVSGADLGQFATVAEALGTLFAGSSPPPRPRGQVIAAFG